MQTINENQIVEQSGIDLFISNIKKKQIKKIINVLNGMNTIMNGQPMEWKLTGCEDNMSVITTRYPSMKMSMGDIISGLGKNEQIVSILLEQLGLTKAKYDGSEFYINQKPVTLQ